MLLLSMMNLLYIFVAVVVVGQTQETIGKYCAIPYALRVNCLWFLWLALASSSLFIRHHSATLAVKVELALLSSARSPIESLALAIGWNINMQTGR